MPLTLKQDWDLQRAAHRRHFLWGILKDVMGCDAFSIDLKIGQMLGPGNVHASTIECFARTLRALKSIEVRDVNPARICQGLLDDPQVFP